VSPSHQAAAAAYDIRATTRQIADVLDGLCDAAAGAA
jgi:hypothetical protein